MSSRKEHWSRFPSTEMGRKNLKASTKAVPQNLNIDFFFLGKCWNMSFWWTSDFAACGKKKKYENNQHFLLSAFARGTHMVELQSSFAAIINHGSSPVIRDTRTSLLRKFLSVAASLCARVLWFLLRLLAGY